MELIAFTDLAGRAVQGAMGWNPQVEIGSVPKPPPQAQMPGGAGAPVVPAVEVFAGYPLDLSAITVPDLPPDVTVTQGKTPTLFGLAPSHYWVNNIFGLYGWILIMTLFALWISLALWDLSTDVRGRGQASVFCTFPPPRDDLPPGATRTYTLDIVERHLDVSSDVAVHAWTYRLADPSAPSGGDLSQPVTPHGWTNNGFAPGPTLRAKEGDLLHVTVRNRTEHPHNLHFHGRHSPQMDGWEPIPPGAETTYEITAAPFGVHPYHCHVMPIAQHIARGMHGVLIVDPPEPRPPALEVLLVLCGWDPDGVQRSSVVTWNGVAGYYAKFPIKAPVGELVRLYLVNMLEYEPVGSFHLHAQTFDLFPSGTSLTPLVHTDVVTLGMAERAILEFTLPERGRYMFHPHQHHLADRGAMGWFSAI